MDEGKMNASRRVLSFTALQSGFGVWRCGVKESDEEHAVRSAYKSLALRFHPDKCTELSSQEATAKFQEVSKAYQA